jgi:hypothetical protein
MEGTMKHTIQRAFRCCALAAAACTLAAGASAQTCPPIVPATWQGSAMAGSLGSVNFTITGLDSPFLASPACSFTGSDYSGAPLPGFVAVNDYGQSSDWVLTLSQPVSKLYVYMCFWRQSNYTFSQPFTLLSGGVGATVSGTTLVPGATFTSGILEFDNVTTLSVVDDGACCGAKQQMTFAYQPQCSSETVRPGNPPNPIALMPGVTSGPVPGATWDPYIDHTSFMPAAAVDLLVVGNAGADLPTGYGTILLDPFSFLLFFAAASPGTPFQVPIPPDPALTGLALSSQGVSIDAASTVLVTNALDIVIG